MTAAAKIVTVRLPGQQYDIRVQAGVLKHVGEYLLPLAKNRQAFVVTDETVSPLHAQKLAQSLQTANFAATIIQLPAGESNKTLQSVEKIFGKLLEARVERSSVVIGLGGGVIGDMSGFAAATALRGVPFVQCPTTLLAMVDASVGGKTGVNHSAGKNLIGAFHQPIAVMIDPETLQTLPTQLISDGLAECIKHEIIRDAAGFDHLEKNIHRALTLDLSYLTELIAHNVAIKARVVEADPMERGERAHLNLGHTFGHAIEKVSNFQVSHGSAVSIGIVAAGHVATALKLLTPSDHERIVKLLQAAGLPTSCPSGLPVASMLDAMGSDKKVESGRIRLVLPDGIGKATIRSDVPDELIREALNSVQ